MTWMALGEDQGKAIEELIKSDSERIIAVVGGALLDNSLRLAIEDRLTPDKDRLRRIFGANGALGGQPKATLAYLLQMFDVAHLQAIEAIYSIRNLFAHNLKMAFDSPDQRMVDAWKNLNLHNHHAVYPHPFFPGASTDRIEDIVDRKAQFLVNLKLLLIILFQDKHRHLPNSNVPPQR